MLVSSTDLIEYQCLLMRPLLTILKEMIMLLRKNCEKFVKNSKRNEHAFKKICCSRLFS